MPDYFYLLGFPALALLLSKAIVQRKITIGDVTKVAPSDAAPAAAVPPPTPSWRDWLGDIINNDAAHPDIADFQYVVLNLVTLTYFFIHLFETPRPLPQIPQTLIVLTGASAGTYVGNKLTQNHTPVLIGLAPTIRAREQLVGKLGAQIVLHHPQDPRRGCRLAYRSPAPGRSKTLARTSDSSWIEGMTVLFGHAYTVPRTLPP